MEPFHLQGSERRFRDQLHGRLIDGVTRCAWSTFARFSLAE